MLEEDGASDADGFGGGGWLGAVLEPVRWLKMLCRELGTTFVAGVVLVYGLSQGFASSFYRVASDYYWKDVQQLQPATVQLLTVFFFLPWVLKPLWGVMTDVFPIRGYRRRPYFLFSGILGTTSAAAVAMITGLPVTSAVICFVGISTGVAIADVTIDACIAKNSIDKPALAPDMQSLCAFSSSLGALIGYATSGMFVHHLGAQGALGLMAIPPAMLVFLGFFIYELQTYQHSAKAKVLNKVSVAVKGMIQTIKYPVVWKPSLYMFLSLALSISTHEGQFYWYTNKTAHNPGFSQIFGKGFKMAQPIRLSHKDDYRAMAAPDLGSATPDPTTCVRERTEGYTRGHTGSGVVARDLRDVARGVLVGATPASGGATHRRTLRRSTGSTQSTEG